MSRVSGAGSPVNRRVRAFFGPVDRLTGTPTAFDAAAMAGVATDDVPAPWIELGPCREFVRVSSTHTIPVRLGAPVTARDQVRGETSAEVRLLFERWGKLQLALSAGVPQLNLLTPGTAALPLLTAGGTSTATTLNVGAAAAGIGVGSLVAVDVDYAGETGYVGSGVSAGYVRSSAEVGGDVDAVRRLTLNVGQVSGVAAGVLTLSAPLLAGVPTAGMQVRTVVGFADREGGGFFQEWSGLFCAEGEQGDRVFFYYPRLQAMSGPAEQSEVLAGPLVQMRLRGSFRALAVKDSLDGTQILCCRSYLPPTP